MNNDLYMDASLRTQACSLNYRNGNSRPEKDDVDKKPFFPKKFKPPEISKICICHQSCISLCHLALHKHIHHLSAFEMSFSSEINTYCVVTLSVRATVIDTKRQSTPKKCQSGLRNCILDTFQNTYSLINICTASYHDMILKTRMTSAIKTARRVYTILEVFRSSTPLIGLISTLSVL